MAETTDIGTSAQPAPVAPVQEPVVEPVAAPAAPQPAPAPLPENAPNRTREQFEKLIESNRRLYEDKMRLETELAQRRQPAQGQNPFQPAPQAPQQVNPNDFVEVDPISGEKFINEQRLRAKIDEVNSKAARLEQVVQSYVKTSEEREIERQEKETYRAHPELNPGSKEFDPVFNRNVRSILTDSFYNQEEYGGQPLTFKEAADFVRAQFPKPTKQSDADQQAQAEAQKAQAAAARAQKEQGSAQAVSQPRGQAEISDEEELETLRYRTRYLNDDWALARRIVNTDHVAKDMEEVA